MPNKEHFDIWKWLKGTSGKLTVVVAIIVAFQFIIPEIKNILIGDDTASKEDLELLKEDLLDSIHVHRSDMYRFKREFKGFLKHHQDQEIKGKEFFALGLRIDKRGDIWYRDRKGDVYRAIPDYERWTYYYVNKEGVTKFCYFEH